MSNFLAIRDGGATDEQGAQRFWRQVSANGQGVLNSGSYQVTPHATPNNSIDVQIGDIAIAYQNYLYHGWSDAINNITIGNNSSGNPRIDSIVAYVDRSVVSSSSNDNPGALKFIAVQGTPAGSPSAPNGTTIQAAVGAGNPYYVLGNVNVPTGFTGASTITNSGTTIIVDQRALFLVGQPPGLGWFQGGTIVVGNDQGFNPPVPSARTFSGMSIHAKTAPTGANLTVQVYNITQAQVVASITLTAGSQDADTTSMSHPSVNAKDRLRLDVLAVGSTVPGADVSVDIY